MEDRSTILTFASKVDVWFVILLVASFGVPVIVLMMRAIETQSSGALGTVVTLGIIAVLPVWIMSTTEYRITAEKLLVRSGPVRVDVPLKSVTGLRASHSVLSAPALSLDRIEVSYGSKRVVISPRDRAGFIAAITERVPGVRLDGL